MRIELSEAAQAIVERQVARGEFRSPSEVVEQAIGFFALHGPGNLTVVEPDTGKELSGTTLVALIQEGLDDEAHNRVGQFDAADIKQRGRERLALRTPTL